MSQSKEVIYHILESGTEAEKSEILENLRGSDDTSLIEPLVEFMENETSRAVRERLLMLLGHLVPLGGYNENDVGRMMRSPDPQVRNGIVEIIKKSDIPIIRFLEKLAKDKDKDVRKFVIDALSREKSEQAIQLIRVALHDTDINIRYTAAEYLGNFGDTGSVDDIEKMLLDSRHLMVTCAGLEALAKIGKSNRKQEILEKFMKENNDPMLNFPLLKYLGRFGSPSSLDHIESLIDRHPFTFAKEVIDAVDSIFRYNRMESLPAPLLRKLESMMETTGNPIDKYAISRLLTGAGSKETGGGG